ncbi:MAG: prolyl oligopeptidase family serine peptidase [Alphaproteobacteria bacterium]|jgi:dipeptidyl aminopeptidase/acylaminoacyl peptidase|nr:prolyl oligopeptidase family serine peptidase [Alphaproteobacteria bacterium]
MFFKKLMVAGWSLACLAPLAGAQVPIEEIARYPAMSNMSMSPEGDTIVGLMTPPGNKGDEQALAVWDLTDEGSAPTLTPSNERMKFIGVEAYRNGNIQVVARQAWTGALAYCGEASSVTGATKTFVTKVYMTDKTAEEFEEPFLRAGSKETYCDSTTVQGGIAAELPFSDDEVIVRRRSRDAQYLEYALYNMETGRSKQLYRENDVDVAGLWDLRNIELLTKERIEISDGSYRFTTLIRNDETGEYEEHPKLTYTAGNRQKISVAGRDEASGKYYVVTDQFADKTELYFYDPVAREYDDQPLFSHPEFPVSGVVLGSRASNYNELIAVTYLGADPERYYVDPEWAAIQEGLEAAFPGKKVRIRDYSDDMSRILFTTSSTTDQPAYYLLEDKKTPRLLGATKPWLDAHELSPTELVYYDARDGLEIPAYLALPVGWKKGDPPAPAIVLPHGGPWSRDIANGYSGGDEWIHFLTSRGYAVLKPQYRGSDDFGRKLWLAGDGEWGQKMQDDKDDGARWLVEQGIADPDRIAIWGYSYGGFAAFAATVREDGPFKCAIAGAGVSNLERLGNLWGSDRIQRKFQGRTVDGMDPMENTDKANIPILIYHGDRDTQVELFHSRDFYNGVKDKVNAKLVVIEDMPHSYPWWPEHFEQKFSEIDSFLKDTCDL